MMRAESLVAVIAFMLVPGPAKAACSETTFDDIPFTVCSVDPGQKDLRLFRLDPDGAILGSFERLEAMLADRDLRPTFAMNAGMYHLDRDPVGLYIENGQQQQREIASDGPGNFGLLPNGVFCIAEHSARVIETLAYQANRADCSFATQSGPMLVIDGALHPRFLPDGTSRKIRNGVGVDDAGKVWFAISDAPVNFHEFARLFRDRLNTPNALFLDGDVSRLYAPDLGRNDGGWPMGPIVATVAPLDR